MTRLTELFIQFHGAFDPLGKEAKEAKAEFHQLVSELYDRLPQVDRVEFTSITFEGVVLLVCKRRAARRPGTT